MKIGVCCEFDRAVLTKEIGFDYLEPTLTGISKKSDKEFKEIVSLLRDIDLKAETCNCFFDASKHMLVGENQSTMQSVREYTKVNLERFKSIGGELAVLGSGGSRSYPDGFSKDRAYSQFLDALFNIAEVAKEYEIIVVIEPLFKGGSNLINTVAEGIEAVKAVNHPNVKVLADLFHVYENKEGYEAIEKSDGLLYHTHISNPVERNYPLPDDGFDLSPFINALKKCGYDRRISLEADTKDFAKEAPESLEILKSFFKG